MSLNPTGERDDTPKISADTADACVWKSPDGHNSVSLSVLPDRSIKDYQANKAQYADYQELSVAGYPAVRANQADPAQAGSCSLFLAVSDHQMLGAFTIQSPITDPCASSQKALEATLPTLPAAK